MDETFSISKARSILLEIPKELSRRKEPKTMTITRRGKPVLAIMTWDFYESIVETLEIMGDADLMNSLKKSIRQAVKGKTVPWEKVKQDLKL